MLGGSSSVHEPVLSQGEVYYYEPVVQPQLQPVELNCIKVIRATEKAVLLLIEFNDAQVELWFPKSVVKLNGNSARLVLSAKHYATTKEQSIMNKLHIMLDLETLGVKLLAPIVQIGAACAVESSGIWELKPMLHFNETIALDEALEHRRPCASTLLWWMKQKESVRDSVLQYHGSTVRQALTLFTKFIHIAQEATASEEVYVWGNGASTDNAWLIGLYEQYGFEVPWKHWGNMCYRTAKNMNRHVPKPEMPEHLQHIAVHDAISQLNHLEAIMNDMRSKTSTQSNS